MNRSKNCICRICGSTKDHQFYVASEKMFGIGGNFNYFQCSDCQCLQIEEINIDLSEFYPANYYSLNAVFPKKKNKLIQYRNKAAIFPNNFLDRFLLKIKPHAPLQALSLVNPKINFHIADIGCGAGHLIYDLHELGFDYITGIDPNINKDITIDKNIKILKDKLENISSKFDIIMFHHSLEHIPDQKSILTAARESLNSNGICLIRVPIVSSYAWRTYKTNWVQLDAPRHLYLHSEKSMKLLAEQTGFYIEQVVYDSSDFQFWGSNNLKENIPLFNINTGIPNKLVKKSFLNTIKYRLKANILNKKHDGDQAIFILRIAK